MQPPAAELKRLLLCRRSPAYRQAGDSSSKKPALIPRRGRVYFFITTIPGALYLNLRKTPPGRIARQTLAPPALCPRAYFV